MTNKFFIFIFLSIGIPLFMWAIGADDPFFLSTGFPWIIIPCLLVSLYYDIKYSLFGLSLLILGSVLYASYKGISINKDTIEVWGGCLFIILITSEITSYWKKSYLSEKQNLHETTEKLNQYEQEIRLLQLSHIQMEVDLLGSHQSLWRSLKLIENEAHTIDPNPHSRLTFLSKKMADILSTYDWLEVAAFYAVNDKGGLYKHPLATLGNMPKPDDHDGLVIEAMRTKKPVSLSYDSSLLKANEQLNTSLVATFPILDKNNQTQLILAVKQINFISFKPANLNLLATLCSWLGSCLEDELKPSHALPVPRMDNPQWRKAEKEIHAALEMVASHQKSTFLLGLMVYNSEHKEDYITHFENNMRGGNHAWRVDRQQGTLVILLLPLLEGESSGMLKQKLEQDFMIRFNQPFDEAGVEISSHYFYRYQHRQELTGYLDLLKDPYHELVTF